ncbi:MAG TPA: hypothetical protein VGF71_05435 [Caulobacteraceae bacterium]|jgi:hypothetical protein
MFRVKQVMTKGRYDCTRLIHAGKRETGVGATDVGDETDRLFRGEQGGSPVGEGRLAAAPLSEVLGSAVKSAIARHG